MPAARRLKTAVIAASKFTLGLAGYYASAIARAGGDGRLLTFWEVADGNARLELFRTKAVRRRLVQARAEALGRELSQSGFEAVVVVKLPELDAAAVDALAGPARRVVNLYPDSPAVHPGLADPAMLSAVGRYHAIITFARGLQPVWAQLGARRAWRLPFAYEPSVHFPVASDAIPPQFRSDLTYLGTAGPLQRRWLQELQEWKPAIFGGGWQRRSKVARAWQMLTGVGVPMPEGSGHELRLACGGARLVFNLIRAEHGCFHSMKTFEIPACGGATICNRTDEQLEFLGEDVAAAYFSCADELRDKVRFLLGNDAARRRLASGGLSAVAPHTYDARAATLMQLLSGL